jgi:hypothetical protein
VARFLLLTRDTHLAYLATADPALAASLGPITANQWLMLQGYLGSLLGTYSSNTFSLFMAFSGAQIIAAEVQVGGQRGSQAQGVDVVVVLVFQGWAGYSACDWGRRRCVSVFMRCVPHRSLSLQLPPQTRPHAHPPL